MRNQAYIEPFWLTFNNNWQDYSILIPHANNKMWLQLSFRIRDQIFPVKAY